MKILVLGLGSMGKRRIRLIQMLNHETEIIGIDSDAERAKQVRGEYGIEVCADLAEALLDNEVRCAVISTSPLSHASLIHQCLQAGLHVFTELNLVSDMYAENIRLAEERGLVLFLSSTFLYRDEVKYIIDKVNHAGSKLNYSYHVGQYLPSWHPWEMYHNFFVGDKRTNGCRELFAIELPWLVKAFGQIKSFHVMKSKNTSLDIDYEDNYILLLEHEGGNKGMLAVDVMSRKAVRNLEVFGEDIYLSWDGTPEGIQDYDYENEIVQNINLYDKVDKLAGYSDFVVENAYKNELVSFFNAIAGKNEIKYTFQEDMEILKFIDIIEGIA